MAAAVGSIVAPFASCSGSRNYSHRQQCSDSKNLWWMKSQRLLGGVPLRLLRGMAGASQRKVSLRKSGAGVPVRACEEESSIDDPFNYGKDPDMEYGDLMTEGKQGMELPGPRRDKNGILNFPAMHNLEISALGQYIRGDVRRCLVWVDGGVYENLLMFPGIQLLKSRYPGVRIDVVASERGKQTWEMNKYINKAHPFDTDAEWTVPADYTEFLFLMRNEYFDLIVSTKYSGFKHAATLFMIGGRTQRVSYVHYYHSEWVSKRFLSKAIVAPQENLANEGYNMYKEIFAYLARPAKGVPEEEIPPLQIGISKRVRSVVKEKEDEAELTEGKFVVFHGIESDSGASMTSRGDTDSLLPVNIWSQLKKQVEDSTGVKVVVVIPHKKEKAKVIAACGDDAAVVFITTPGQLAALIRDSAGVVSTNTAAMQMAVALKKPSVVLFGSAEKASLFVPPNAKKIKVVVSKTGKLGDVDIGEATSAWRFVSEGQLVLAS